MNKRIKELNDLIDKNYYLDTMDIYGVRRFKYQSILKKEDFILLISLAKEGNREALNVFLKYYYQVVINFSLKYSSDFLDKEDLVEAGLIGFLEAVKSYDIENKKALFAIVKEGQGIYKKVQITKEQSK